MLLGFTDSLLFLTKMQLRENQDCNIIRNTTCFVILMMLIIFSFFIWESELGREVAFLFPFCCDEFFFSGYIRLSDLLVSLSDSYYCRQIFLNKAYF